MRGGEHGIHGNPRHATVIHRTAPQKTRTAGNGLANQSELFRHRSSALRIRRTKNSDDRKARGRGHVHGSGIVADKYRAGSKQRRQIAHGCLADQGNGARLHLRTNASRNFLFTRRAKKYHIGATFRNQAIREVRKPLRRPALGRAVGSAGSYRAAPCVFSCARASAARIPPLRAPPR